jgi:hypothetical protein
MGRVFDWWFRDRATGRVVVGQFPNAALWAFLLALLVGRVPPAGSTVRSGAEIVATAALTWWGVDELARG